MQAGKRTLTPHIYALGKFGIKIKVKEGEYEISRNKLGPCENLIMYESGDGDGKRHFGGGAYWRKNGYQIRFGQLSSSGLVPFSGWLGCEDGRNRNDHLDHFRPENLNQEYHFQLARTR